MDLLKISATIGEEGEIKLEAQMPESKGYDERILKAMKDYAAKPFVTLHAACSGAGLRDIALRVVLEFLGRSRHPKSNQVGTLNR